MKVAEARLVAGSVCLARRPPTMARKKAQGECSELSVDITRSPMALCRI